LLTGICNKRDEKEKKDKKELCFPTKKKFYAKKKEKKRDSRNQRVKGRGTHTMWLTGERRSLIKA